MGLQPESVGTPQAYCLGTCVQLLTSLLTVLEAAVVERGETRDERLETSQGRRTEGGDQKRMSEGVCRGGEAGAPCNEEKGRDADRERRAMLL